MDNKIGLYICTGCGIGEAIDADRLIDIANEDFSPSICKTHECLCSPEGVEILKADIDSGNINKVGIAACSSRVMYDIFDFTLPTERINIREQVVWSQPPADRENIEEDDTQMMAEDYIRMGRAKLNKELPLEPFKSEAEYAESILVVGGGITGMNAAIDASKAGYSVVLVEKADNLGGWALKLYKKPSPAPHYTEISDPGVKELVEDLEKTSNIKVYTGSVIKEISGAPCMFDVTIQKGTETHDERVGAIVLATGAVPYDATKLGHLGYGNVPNVITHEQFEAMAKKRAINRPSDNTRAECIAFIQCAGSRDENHLNYCSATCCVESLKQAKIFKELNPEGQVYILYRDIRAYGHYELLYKEMQNEGVIFIKGDVNSISENGSGGVQIDTNDFLSQTEITLDMLDLVILATGMVPSTSIEIETEKIKKEADDSEKTDAQAKDAPLENMASGKILASNILNLNYRQGPELPELKYGFPDSHFICFPYETRRTGIYAAGSVRAPMDIYQAIDDAGGAALKAIQCVELSKKGLGVHPRANDISYPEFDMSRCTQCKRCTEECPFGAINEDEKSNPLPNPTRCRRCGICMGACPERIISFKNYSVPLVGNMLKAINVPEEFDEKPRILILACENDAYPALDMVGINRLQLSPWIRVISVRCLGSLNLIWIADSLSAGIDGVLLLGCKHGDDYQCHFIQGSALADIRLSKISETLDRLALESERVRILEVSITDFDKLPGMIKDFEDTLEELGPNPMKGF